MVHKGDKTALFPSMMRLTALFASGLLCRPEALTSVVDTNGHEKNGAHVSEDSHVRPDLIARPPLRAAVVAPLPVVVENLDLHHREGGGGREKRKGDTRDI